MREQIINILKKDLEQKEYVYAAWLTGSLATNDADEHSDIDIWFDIDNNSVDRVFGDIEESLNKLSVVDNQFDQSKPNKDIRNRFYHLAGTPETLQIDVSLRLNSSGFVFTRGIKDQEAVVLFDKKGVIKYEDLDEEKLKHKNLLRLEELKNLYKGMRPAVLRQLKRGKYLTAFDYYFYWVLEPLVEVLRIAYQPTKVDDWGLKHIYKDLPFEIIGQLEELYKPSSVEKISSNLEIADKLFEQAIHEAKNT